jgi:hypothetical protein
VEPVPMNIGITHFSVRNFIHLFGVFASFASSREFSAE